MVQWLKLCSPIAHACGINTYLVFLKHNYIANHPCPLIINLWRWVIGISTDRHTLWKILKHHGLKFACAFSGTCVLELCHSHLETLDLLLYFCYLPVVILFVCIWASSLFNGYFLFCWFSFFSAVVFISYSAIHHEISRACLADGLDAE